MKQCNKRIAKTMIGQSSHIAREIRECSTLRAEPIFLAHAENRLCGIPVLFPLSTRCQLSSYNIVSSHFNHRLTVVNCIKRAAHIKNWFKPVVSSKLLDEAKQEYRGVYFARGGGKLALLAG